MRWHATGTFAGDAAYQGIAPTGGRVTLAGIDLLRVSDGQIVANEAYPDGVGFARQIGLMPAAGSATEARLFAAFNARTRAARRLAGAPAEPVADGVWLVRGGVPRTMNVYLIEDEGGGVTVFDAGTASMTRAVAAAAGALGGDQPRRARPRPSPTTAASPPGSARPCTTTPPTARTPRATAGGSYFHFERLRPLRARRFPRLLDMWDGGPVRIAGTSRRATTSAASASSTSPATRRG